MQHYRCMKKNPKVELEVMFPFPLFGHADTSVLVGVPSGLYPRNRLFRTAQKFIVQTSFVLILFVGMVKRVGGGANKAVLRKCT